MYCTNCGVYLNNNVSYCTNCGHKVEQHTHQNENIMDQLNTGYQNIMSRPKSKLVAGLLAVLLGGIGAHDFYLGYTRKGIAHLLMYVFFLGWLSGIWALIEALYIFTDQNAADADGVLLIDGF